MQDYEIPTQFYLGREYDLEHAKAKENLLLYDSKDLVTHAVCVGMTGSGKTGLCLSLLEEAAIDGIPAIMIDPKGDLGNLLLTFPDLEPSDFKPGSTKAKQLAKESPSMNTPKMSPNVGRKVSPIGDNHLNEFKSFATLSISPSTHQAATPVCQSPY